MNKEKCLVFPACLVRYMCLAFCVWIIQSKPPWMYIYGAGSQRKYIRTLLITSFDPQFPRPKLLPTNRYHKEIRSPLGSNCRHAALSQEKRKEKTPQGKEVFFFSKVDHWGFFPKVSHCTNVVYFQKNLLVLGSNCPHAALNQEMLRSAKKKENPRGKGLF